MSFEDALSTFENQVHDALVRAKATAAALARLERAVQGGTTEAFSKEHSDAMRLAAEAVAAVAGLDGAFTYDVKEAMASGAFLAEVEAAANGAGLRAFVRDGRLYSFPLLVRAESAKARVRVSGKSLRTVRPSVLVRLLAKEQGRPLAFKEATFLGVLFRAYTATAGEAKSWARDAGPVVFLRDLHELLTLHPGTEYPVDEFARDLLLLDRKPDLRVKGCRFEFPGATVSKERIKPIVVFDEDGAERAYYALRFIREPTP